MMNKYKYNVQVSIEIEKLDEKSKPEKRVKSVSPQNNVLDVGVNVIFKYNINSNMKEELSQHLEPSCTAYYPDMPTRSSNKDEAVRAKELALKKLSSNDFEGAKKVGLKAQKLYPEVEEISQLLKICDVHCCAEKRILGSEKDLYGILQVERRADGSTIRKQYKRLALHLHPDKNRLPGAEAAFKLISEAHEILSNSAKKSLYDTKIRVF